MREPVVPLRDYVDRIFAEHDARVVVERERLEDSVALAREVSERALREARATIETRLSELNNLRLEVVEDRNALVRREVLDAMLSERDAKIGALEDWRNRAVGALALGVLFAGVIGAAIMRALTG